VEIDTGLRIGQCGFLRQSTRRVLGERTRTGGGGEESGDPHDSDPAGLYCHFPPGFFHGEWRQLRDALWANHRHSDVFVHSTTINKYVADSLIEHVGRCDEVIGAHYQRGQPAGGFVVSKRDSRARETNDGAQGGKAYTLAGCPIGVLLCATYLYPNNNPLLGRSGGVEEARYPFPGGHVPLEWSKIIQSKWSYFSALSLRNEIYCHAENANACTHREDTVLLDPGDIATQRAPPMRTTHDSGDIADPPKGQGADRAGACRKEFRPAEWAEAIHTITMRLNRPRVQEYADVFHLPLEEESAEGESRLASGEGTTGKGADHVLHDTSSFFGGWFGRDTIRADQMRFRVFHPSVSRCELDHVVWYLLKAYNAANRPEILAHVRRAQQVLETWVRSVALPNSDERGFGRSFDVYDGTGNRLHGQRFVWRSAVGPYGEFTTQIRGTVVVSNTTVTGSVSRHNTATAAVDSDLVLGTLGPWPIWRLLHKIHYSFHDAQMSYTWVNDKQIYPSKWTVESDPLELFESSPECAAGKTRICRELAAWSSKNTRMSANATAPSSVSGIIAATADAHGTTATVISRTEDSAVLHAVQQAARGELFPPVGPSSTRQHVDKNEGRKRQFDTALSVMSAFRNILPKGDVWRRVERASNRLHFRRSGDTITAASPQAALSNGSVRQKDRIRPDVFFPSQFGADKWVLQVYNCSSSEWFVGVNEDFVNNFGDEEVNDEFYYFDIGSAQGFVISNTWLLDMLGWKGVCVEPFTKTRTYSGRTCKLVEGLLLSDEEKAREAEFGLAEAPGRIMSVVVDPFGDLHQGNSILSLNVTAALKHAQPRLFAGQRPAYDGGGPLWRSLLPLEANAGIDELVKIKPCVVPFSGCATFLFRANPKLILTQTGKIADRDRRNASHAKKEWRQAPPRSYWMTSLCSRRNTSGVTSSCRLFHGGFC